MKRSLFTSGTARRAWRGWIACLALAALLPQAGTARSDEPATETPKLAGIWKLNEKESESFDQKMKERMGSGDHGGGGRGEGGGWHGGGGGMGGGSGRRGGWGGGRHGQGGPEGGGSGGDGPRRNPEMAELAHPATTLLIEQSDTTLVLSESGQTLQTLAVVSKTPAHETAPPASAPPQPAAVDSARVQPLSYQAWWDRSRLMAERVTARGGRMSEVFALGKDGKSLVIRTSIELRPDTPAIEIRRVYDRYEGE